MSDFYNKKSVLFNFRSDNIFIFDNNNQIYDHPETKAIKQLVCSRIPGLN